MPHSPITHTVFFKLRVEESSAEATNFFIAANDLAAISGVRNFRCVRQVSSHSTFNYGICMEFESRELYEAYSNHADHVAFVETYWKNLVEDFLELDYVPF